MKKLKLNKFKIAKLDALNLIRGGAQNNSNSGSPDCPYNTINKTLSDPDLPADDTN